MSVTIGVFDSGFGGLTVLRALLPQLPGVDFVYLGDSARLPYGSKSQATIARYAVSAAKFLEQEGAEFLVIACNTASALALDDIRAAARVPVLGVIETGAAAANAASITRDVLVLGTTATVESHAYANACAAHGLRVVEKACPLFVPLVEEGWIHHPVTADVANIYLTEALNRARAAGLSPDTLLLGCTHYPLLRELLESTLDRMFAEPLQIIDSAGVTAAAVARHFSAELRELPPSAPSIADCTFFATDSVAKFQSLGSQFLGQPIDHVTHIDLEE
jgi:glutamate racemase